MSGTPGVSRKIFDPDKRYLGRKYRPGKELCDWDINEDWDEAIWWQSVQFRELLGGDSGGLSISDTLAFSMKQAAVTTNNFAVNKGLAFVNGRPVYVDAQFDYDESGLTPTNYILKGTVSSMVENTPSVDYDVEDAEKNFVDNHGLDGSSSGLPARIRFTSGALSGSTFDINARVDGTSFNVVADLSTVLAGDTYVLLPPELITPPGPGNQTDNIYLVVFFESTSEVEDPDLEDPALTITPSYRDELRWMLYVDWNGTDDTDITEGFSSELIGTIVRAPADSSVDTGDITVLLKDIRALNYIKHNENAIVDSEFAPSNAGSGIPQFDIGASSYDVGELKFNSGYNYSGESERWLAQVTGSTGNHPTAGNKSFGLSVSSNGKPTTAAEFSATADIEKRQLVTIISHVDTANKHNIRASRMGERLFHRGFNWYVSGTDILVQPGERFGWGTLLQLDRTFTIDTTTAVLTWANDSWGYIYMARKNDGTADLRSLIGFVDNDVPNWDGSHPDPAAVAGSFDSDGDAFCIGMTYKDGAGTIHASHCIDNHVFIREDATDYKAFEIRSTAIVNDSETAMEIEPPAGASELFIEFDIEQLTTAASDIELDILWKQGGSEIWKRRYRVQTDVGATETRKLTYKLEFPGSMGSGLFVKSSTIATINYKVGLSSFKFNPINFADNRNWSED